MKMGAALAALVVFVLGQLSATNELFSWVRLLVKVKKSRVKTLVLYGKRNPRLARRGVSIFSQRSIQHRSNYSRCTPAI